MTDFEKIPAFPGGTPVDGIYNAGPMLADDKEGPTDEDAKTQADWTGDHGQFVDLDTGECPTALTAFLARILHNI